MRRASRQECSTAPSSGDARSTCCSRTIRSSVASIPAPVPRRSTATHPPGERGARVPGTPLSGRDRRGLFHRLGWPRARAGGARRVGAAARPLAGRVRQPILQADLRAAAGACATRLRRMSPPTPTSGSSPTRRGYPVRLRSSTTRSPSRASGVPRARARVTSISRSSRHAPDASCSTATPHSESGSPSGIGTPTSPPWSRRAGGAASGRLAGAESPSAACRRARAMPTGGSWPRPHRSEPGGRLGPAARRGHRRRRGARVRDGDPLVAEERRGGHRPAHRARQPPPAPGRPRADRRGRESTQLTIFDLDGFKNYNDAFGHQAGDELLARPRPQAGGGWRSAAAAYRLGGDGSACSRRRDGGTAPRCGGRAGGAVRSRRGVRGSAARTVPREIPYRGDDGEHRVAPGRRAALRRQAGVVVAHRAARAQTSCTRVLQEREPRARGAPGRCRGAGRLLFSKRARPRRHGRRRGTPRRRSCTTWARSVLPDAILEEARAARRRGVGASSAGHTLIGERIVVRSPGADRGSPS